MLQAYAPLLVLHVAAAIASPALFSLRAARALQGIEPGAGWLRVAPHAIDTLLLVSGVLLAVAIRQYPFVDAWLTAKVVALLVYVALGHLAVRRARTRVAKLVAWVAALAVVAYIYAVAFTHSALPGLARG